MSILILAIASDAGDDLVRHAAFFTRFCDHGSVAEGNCWCKGGPAAAAIGDGSWLWSELVGSPCPAQPNDRCDCENCGGVANSCPHEGCWQCEGVNAPQCNPSDALKRCEVSVHGTHGMEKFYLTEVCPSSHPCNRCKEKRLQRCANWSPMAVDICGTNWGNVFEKTRAEAQGFVTLSCYPNAYNGEAQGVAVDALKAEADADGAGQCVSRMEGDVNHASCEEWCSTSNAADHCKWCKCRGCSRMAGACADIISKSEAEVKKRAALRERCGGAWDCLTWCNIGNCGDCRCAGCERCGPEPPLATPLLTPKTISPHKGIVPPAASVNAALKAQPAGCHGWCIAGGAEDPDVVCRSSKCQACPLCAPLRGATSAAVSL